MERIPQAAEHAALLLGGGVELFLLELTQETLVAADGSLSDNLTNTARGDFHEAGVIHL
jgi:hypothetical protein